jgi:hypothetical protein
LDGDEPACDEDEGRDDHLERTRRKRQQEDGPRDPTRPARGEQRDGALALTGQFPPIAECSADRSRDQTNGVADVGHERRETEEYQRRKGDQRARSDDGIDGSGTDAREKQQGARREVGQDP